MSNPNPCALHVFVSGADKLGRKDIFGICDPYVQVTLSSPNQQQNMIFRTKTVKKTLNPVWRERFEFPRVNPREHYIIFEVYDEHRVTKDNCIGGIKVKLSDHRIEVFEAHRRSARLKRVPVSNQCKKTNIAGDSIKLMNAPLHKRNQGSKSKVMGQLHFKLLFFQDTTAQPRQMDLGALVVGSSTSGREHSPSSRGSVSNPSRRSSQDSHGPAGAVAVRRQTSSSSVSGTSGSRQNSSSQLPRQAPQQTSSWFEEEGAGEPEEPLPPGWEERQDGQARTFFIDHLNRRTQWNRPTTSAASTTEAVQRQQDLEMRHFTMRRQVGDRSGGAGSSRGELGPPPTRLRSQTSSNQDSPLMRSGSQNSSSSRPGAGQQDSPVLRSGPQDPAPGTPTTPTSRSNGQLDRSSRRDSPKNDDNIPLPPGWEKRTKDGTSFYVNHNSRVTQWEHPGKSEVKRSSSKKAPNYKDMTPEQLDKELGALEPGWEIRKSDNGKYFFVDHNTRSTQWEDPRIVKLKNEKLAAVPYSRDYKRKYEHFKSTLPKPPEQPKQFEIPVRRDRLFEDSHRAIMGCRNKEQFHSRVWVKFDKEKGLDYGGVAREWFFLLSHEMFNPYYGLFEYTSSENYILMINPDSGRCNDDHLSYFKFIGRVCGMAVYHKKLIDGFFIRPIYKYLLGKRVALQDIESCDMEFYNSTRYILDNDPEPLCLTFSVTREWLGQVTEIDLKPGGSGIEVTEENKEEYVHLMLKYQFETRVKDQMDAFVKGFCDVIPLQNLKIFDGRELEYLLCGLSEINVDDWRKNTNYVGFKETDDVVVWFWKALENFDLELRARLLQFATGTSRVPMNGFAELHGSNGPQKFCLKRLGEPDSLPRSHTCFNRVDLPPYRSYHELKEKVRLAIENTEGFEGVD